MPSGMVRALCRIMDWGASVEEEEGRADELAMTIANETRRQQA
jgi:hypothetical protein